LEEKDLSDQAGVAKGMAGLRRVLTALSNFLPFDSHIEQALKVVSKLHMVGAFLLSYVCEEDVFWLMVATVVGQTMCSIEFTLASAFTVPRVEASVTYDLIWAKLTPEVRNFLFKSMRNLDPVANASPN
jgi:hypothetical protein